MVGIEPADAAGSVQAVVGVATGTKLAAAVEVDAIAAVVDEVVAVVAVAVAAVATAAVAAAGVQVVVVGLDPRMAKGRET